ncbi:MAG TPA: hypothetical protein VFS20_18270 [Longimicrobium sp.]|nr:hypothetical protein [Longimicrobium sp.]
MHEWVAYRREVMRTPSRTLAAEIGISRSAVDKFHRLRSPPGKNWPKLRDWYMATRTTKIDEYQTPPELMVASALQTLSWLPNSKQAQALRIIAETYRAICVDLKEPLPEWVQMLADLADREGAA